MSGNDEFKGLIDELGRFGMAKAGAGLQALIDRADSPWKRALLALSADAVKRFGPRGIAEAQWAVDRILRGQYADLSFATLRVRSDVLARLQNLEADRRNEARDFMALVAKNLGQLLAGVIKGIVASA